MVSDRLPPISARIVRTLDVISAMKIVTVRSLQLSTRWHNVQLSKLHYLNLKSDLYKLSSVHRLTTITLLQIGSNIVNWFWDCFENLALTCHYTVDDSCLNYFFGTASDLFWGNGQSCSTHCMYVFTHQSPFGDIICCCYAVMCHFNTQYDAYRIHY